MADEDKHIEDIGDNDEYQFADLDGLGTEPVDLSSDGSYEGEMEAEGVASPPSRGKLDPQMIKIIKNGVFAVGGLILFVLIYKFIASFFASSDEMVVEPSPVVATPSTAKPDVQPKKPLPLQVSKVVPEPAEKVSQTSQISQASERERRRLNADLLAMHKQLRDVSQTMSAMTSSIDDLKQSMEQINDKLERQSQQVARLKSVQKAKARTVAPVSKRARKPQPRYFIQAVIPGRAWLISSQGKTLTISRGSSVPGYGSVRLINAKLGRVFTSSGRVIQFSQADT